MKEPCPFCWCPGEQFDGHARASDQLADAGVAVQQQFRSDQERIAELELRLTNARAQRDRLAVDAHDQMHLLRQRAWAAERARNDARERVAELELELEKTRGLDGCT